MRAAYAYNLPPKALPLFAGSPVVLEDGIEFLNPHWMPAALKAADSGTGHVLRFWNASAKSESGLIRLPSRYKKATRARLDETPLGPVKVTKGRLRLTAKPFEIVTLLLNAPPQATA
jgi:alpha-mannosidase